MGIRSRLSVGMVGLGVLAVGAYASATLIPSWSAPVTVLQSSVRPEGASRHLECAGGILGYVGDSADITVVARVALGSMGGLPVGDLATIDGNNGREVAPDDIAATVVATESASLASGTLAGYLATECGDSLNEQWLVGGSTTIGRDSILTLSNGGDVDAHVDLEVWGSSGVINAPGSRGIVVPAHSQRSYALAGFAPDEPSPAVRVVGTGAGVWATLQSTTVRGLEPGGLDRIGPVARSATRLNFPIVRIPEEKSIGPVLNDPTYSDVVPAIRLLNPGDSAAKTRIALEPLGDGSPHSVSLTLDPGVVTDLPLADLAAGDWTISVTSVSPIVGSVRTGYHNKSSGITDIAWESAAPAHAGSVDVFVPLAGTLGIVNPGNEVAHVGIMTEDLVRYFDIDAGGSMSLDVGPGAVSVQSATPVAAAVFLQAGSGIATIRAIAPPLASGSVVVVHG